MHAEPAFNPDPAIITSSLGSRRTEKRFKRRVDDQRTDLARIPLEDARAAALDRDAR